MEYPVLDPKRIGARIKELRIQNGLRVLDICEALYLVSEQSVYHWQSGSSLPSLDNLYALSILFNTTVDDILCINRAAVEIEDEER